MSKQDLSRIFCIINEDWRKQILAALAPENKVVLLESICQFANIPAEQKDYALNPCYIDDAIIAYSQIASESNDSRDQLIETFAQLLRPPFDQQKNDFKLEHLHTANQYTSSFGTKKSIDEVITFSQKLSPELQKKPPVLNLNNRVRPSQEQQEAIDLSHDGLVVNSFAGTGKTTLASHIAEKLGYENTLYTAFLREIADEAKQRVTSRSHTQDSLAYKYVLERSPFASSFNPKSSSKLSNAGAVQMVLGLPPKLNLGDKTVKYYFVSRLIQDTVFNFCNSTQSEVSESHVPKQVVNPKAIDEIRRWAAVYWDFLVSRNEHDQHVIKFHHLMKYWALRPDIQLPEKFTNLIIDEAQDTNGAFYQVMQNHKDRNFVVIGDKHQQLFRWRGAINTMNLFDLPKKFLTLSRRFGQEIAVGANSVLEKHSQPPDKSNRPVITSMI